MRAIQQNNQPVKQRVLPMLKFKRFDPVGIAVSRSGLSDKIGRWRFNILDMRIEERRSQRLWKALFLKLSIFFVTPVHTLLAFVPSVWNNMTGIERPLLQQPGSHSCGVKPSGRIHPRLKCGQNLQTVLPAGKRPIPACCGALNTRASPDEDCHLNQWHTSG